MRTPWAWILFFLLCFGFGFFQGSSPDPFTKNSLSTAVKIHIMLTDEALFPEELRSQIELEHNIQFSTTITRDWNTILAASVSRPGADLIFLPRNWAQSLHQQNLLTDLNLYSPQLKEKLFSDFKITRSGFTFFPLYWLKTSIQLPEATDFNKYLNNKADDTLFLVADEDLILRHFEIWEEQGLLTQVQTKRVLTLPLEQLNRELPANSAAELPLRFPEKESGEDGLSALHVWGVVIPSYSSQQGRALRILELLTSKKYQESVLLKTPFNSTLLDVTGVEIPSARRGDFIRELKLKNTIILDSKKVDAETILKEKHNFLL